MADCHGITIQAAKEPKPPPDKPLPWGPEPRPAPPVRCSRCGGILPNCNCGK